MAALLSAMIERTPHNSVIHPADAAILQRLADQVGLLHLAAQIDLLARSSGTCLLECATALQRWQ